MPDWDTIARMNALRRQVDALTREVSAAERAALTAAQIRFDAVGAYTGNRAPAPILGETALDYRKRLLAPLAAKSDRFKHSRLAPLDSPTLATIEDIVYHDAVEQAKQVPSGELRAVSERDAAGRLVTRYYGDNGAWMQHFATPGVIGTINRNPAPKT